MAGVKGMKGGGFRVGAGRRSAEQRPTFNFVSEATAKLDRAQPKACDTLIAALDAVREDGHPDWSARIAAAKYITEKRIPSIQRTVLVGDADQPIEINHNLNFSEMTDEELDQYLDKAKKG